jgi:hypothetical protein
LLWMIYFPCHYQSCNQLESFTLNVGMYLHRAFVWGIDVLYIHRWYNQLYIFAWNYEKYWNRTLLKNILSLCVRKSYYQLEISPVNGENSLHMTFVWIVYLLCVHQSCNKWCIFASNYGKYLNSMLLGIIQLFYFDELYN